MDISKETGHDWINSLTFFSHKRFSLFQFKPNWVIKALLLPYINSTWMSSLEIWTSLTDYFHIATWEMGWLLFSWFHSVLWTFWMKVLFSAPQTHAQKLLTKCLSLKGHYTASQASSQYNPFRSFLLFFTLILFLQICPSTQSCW